MKILYIDFTLKTKSLDIYTSGCKGPHCSGCHNPESWNFNQGDLCNELIIDKIKNYINDYNGLINNIMIFGGEPLDNNTNEVINFLSELKMLNKKIWLFTRYDLDKIPSKIINKCDYIKTGRYIPSLKTDDNIQYGIKLATSNQNIIDVSLINI